MTTADPLTMSILAAGRRHRQAQIIESIQACREWEKTPLYLRFPWRRPKGYGTGRWGI